jgi:hypothetical protein
MPRNGLGTYSLPAGQPVVTGTTISSSTFNTLTSDLATALTQSLAIDGQAVPTANLPMGGYKLTGLANGSASADSATYGQVTNLIAADRKMYNRIINGDMRIDQRLEGAGFTLTAGAALIFPIDRWYAYCQGANVSAARIAGSGSTQYRLQLVGAPGVTAIGVGQRIEQADCYDLAGQTVTLSATLANNLLPTVTWAAYYANSTNAFGTVASPTRTLISTGTFAVTSSHVRYSASFAVPAAATTGIEIVFTVGAQISSSLIISEVQLELGSAASTFERRAFADELIRCQRFYQKSYNPGTAQGTATTIGQVVGRQGSATTLLDSLTSRLSPSMFSTPTQVLFWSPSSGTSNRVRDNTGAADLIVSGNSYEGANSTGQPTVSAAVTANNQLAAHWSAVSEIP